MLAKELKGFQETSRPTMQPLRLRDTVKQWLWLNSLGGRLFWVIMLGTLTGIGGMAFLFSEMLKRQAEDQVRSSLDSKVNAIASVTESAETLASSLGVSAVTLNARKAQYADTYRELVLQLFEQRSDFVIGLGLGQAKKGILENKDWLFPYYSDVSAGKTTNGDQETIRYENFADSVGEFYPDSEAYNNYFLLQKRIWSDPYTAQNTRRLTYYYPLFNQDDRWLGTTLVDIDTAYLNQLLDDKVFQQAGNFLLLTRSGLLIADPTNPFTKVQNYNNVAGINDIWDQVDQEQSGFIRGDTGYWAYSTVPGKDWLLFGFVPYDAIFGRIVRITAVITTLVGLLITVVIYLAIRTLNQRIKPILLQANQFADNDEQFVASSARHDELDQLSLSFFNLLKQLNLHQETIHRHEASIAQGNLHTDQVTENFLAFTGQIHEDVHRQQELVQTVKQRLMAQGKEYQAIHSQLETLFTLAYTLKGSLESVPLTTEVTELFDRLDERILGLSVFLEHESHTHKVQSKTLLTQLISDVASLRSHYRQQTGLAKLQHQTSNIDKTRQTAVATAQAMEAITQSINQIMAEIEAITNILNQDTHKMSTMLWENLQKTDLIIPDELQGGSLGLDVSVPDQ